MTPSALSFGAGRNLTLQIPYLRDMINTDFLPKEQTHYEYQIGKPSDPQ